MQYIVSSDWHLLFGNIHLRFLHVFFCGSMAHFSLALKIMFPCLDGPQFISHLRKDISVFPSLAIINKAAVNIRVQAFVETSFRLPRGNTTECDH